MIFLKEISRDVAERGEPGSDPARGRVPYSLFLPVAFDPGSPSEVVQILYGTINDLAVK